jgi:uncharacterized protein
MTDVPTGQELGEPIVANSVLPAHREPVTLTTEDGLRLVGELATPLDAPIAATMLCLHPLPTHGGMMDSHVLRKAAWRLPALAGIAVLRWNSRGTTSAAGTSEGEFDEARGEGRDLRAALAFTAERGLPSPWLVGWSFGTDVALIHGDVDPVQGAVLLSPPLRYSADEHLDSWARSGRPLVCVVPEHDDYLRPDEARQRFARVPQAQVIGVDDAKHLWVGERSVSRVLQEVTSALVPGMTLPSRWDGPMDRWNDLA